MVKILDVSIKLCGRDHSTQTFQGYVSKDMFYLYSIVSGRVLVNQVSASITFLARFHRLGQATPWPPGCT